jgi:arsenate reductase
MAEGWARRLKSDCVEAFSAGTNPHGVNKLAVQVMLEAGVDISKHTSKHIDELQDIRFDYVVTVCGAADESCPVLTESTKKRHHGFDDPPKLAASMMTEGEALQVYRRVRDEIRAYIETFPSCLME